MDKQLFTILDFINIKALLEKEIFTVPGKKFLQSLSPGTKLSLVQEWQRETTEMKNILEQEGNPPFTPLKDIQSQIKQSEIEGSILNTEELLAIARVLECLNLIREFFNKIPPEQYNLISKKVSKLKAFRLLEKEIKDCINEEAEIVDEASPTLKKIRQRIHNAEKKIRERLETMIRDPRNRTFIQDDIITIRQGRYVIPIKQQEKGKFPGVIHDKSESGVTVFIEPLAIVELNNELRDLYQEERKEIYRILQKLTALVGQNGQDILYSYQHLGNLDFICAKAKISLKMNAIEPRLNPNGVIHLYQARHPLLKDKAVPINIELGEKFDVLVITGPNTGGKTVTLKTVGLLHLMAQSGLHIPAGLDSEIGIFGKIFADIGDEQSIEQNLSTFSSHMQRIIKILKTVDENTLILLDELGAGTDPSEGSALGMSILDALRGKGAKILSTTHHDSLKAYAYLTEKVMNARVEFDEITLQPTYEISIGLPGKSCAFSVAQRLGIPDRVISDAERYLAKEKMDLENLIKKMERDRDLMTKNLEHSEKEKLHILELKKELELKIDAFEKEKQQVKLETYREAEEIIATIQQKARKIFQSLRKRKFDQEELTEEMNLLEGVKQEIGKNIKIHELSGKDEIQVQEGDRVIIKNLNKKGVVIEKNEKRKQCQVQVDYLKLTVPFSDIQIVNSKPVFREKGLVSITKESLFQSSSDRLEKKAQFNHEINIRQMNARDSQIRLEKYLDDAFMLNVSPVYIIHGKGRGILRATVTSLLDKLSYVKSYRSGNNQEGGDGVTVVYF